MKQTIYITRPYLHELMNDINKFLAMNKESRLVNVYHKYDTYVNSSYHVAWVEYER